MERFQNLGKQVDAHKNGIWALSRVSEAHQEEAGEFISGGSDGMLKTWRFRSEKVRNMEDEENKEESKDLGPLQNVHCFSRHSLPVVNVAMARNSHVAASTSLDGVVKIWDVTREGGEAKSIQQLNITETWAIAVTGDGRRVITGGSKGMLQIIDSSVSTVERTYTIGQDILDGKEGSRREHAMIMSIALSDDDSHVAVGAQDGSVSIVDVETGKSIGGEMTKHGGPVRGISFLPNEKHTVITASDDHLINFYDADSGHVTGTCRGHDGMVLSANGSDDGTFVVSGGSDCMVYVWDRVMMESIYKYEGHKEAVWGTSFAAKGSRIVSVSDDGCIGVLNSSNADVVS